MTSVVMLRHIRHRARNLNSVLSYTASYHGASRDIAPKTRHVIDLRSDVRTLPSEGMRAAMMSASTGDDVFNDDKSVHDLQDMMAELFGKEAALFVPSGTMGNLISIMSQTSHGRGLEVLVGDMSHLTLYEQGGLAMIAHVQPRTMPNKADGTFDLDSLDDYIRPLNDPHQPWTAVISVENTHNNCGGKVIPVSFLEQLREKTDKHGIKVHMDGARLMNAAVALDIEPKNMLQYVDTVSMCFSKGVGTPIGSIIAGDKDFIARSVRLRKALGGGWRQPGMLAEAALYAMQDVRDRMALDHKHAKHLAKSIMENSYNTVHVDVDGVHTNLILIKMIKPGLTAKMFCDRLNTITECEDRTLGERVAVQAVAFYPTIARLCTHSSLTTNHIEFAIEKICYVIHEFSQQ